jgi:Fuc2NAc and GlcNAc transferase
MSRTRPLLPRNLRGALAPVLGTPMPTLLLPVLAAYLAAVAASAALTGLVRHYALRNAVLDVPNQRSSHRVPTPRGGGLAIAVVVLGATVGAALGGLIPREVATALAGGGALVATVGWIDDHRPLPARWRVLSYGAAAVWALAWLGGMPRLDFGLFHVPLGWAGWLVGGLAIVWFTNLYNFMDGIDGIAGGEAALAGAIGAGLLLAAGEPGLALIAITLSAAGAGFLLWNWAPARIFMGDVGSCTIGFVFVVLTVASENRQAVPALAWAILLGVFAFDATVTLVRRVARGERWAEAHHVHAYQRAVQSGRTHGQVAGAALLLTLLLGILAAVGWRLPAALPFVLLGAGVLLAGVYVAVERLRPMPRSGPESRRAGSPATGA